jgi:hypothetical protein
MDIDKFLDNNEEHDHYRMEQFIQIQKCLAQGTFSDNDFLRYFQVFF